MVKSGKAMPIVPFRLASTDTTIRDHSRFATGGRLPDFSRNKTKSVCGMRRAIYVALRESKRGPPAPLRHMAAAAFQAATATSSAHAASLAPIA